ncbi:MAG: TonB family protein [Bacteroides sp.]|nr:TonB family protein [Bacteroides sp.]
MNHKKRGKYVGIGGALLVHLLFIAFLMLVGFTQPLPQEEEGIAVMLGDVPETMGMADPSLVKVDVVEEMPAPIESVEVEQEIITQDVEETVTLVPKAEAPKKEVKKPEKTEAEKAEEARRLAEAKAERERKEAEEKARQRVAGAFGKGAQMSNKGNTSNKEGLQGSPTGNASTGKTEGEGGNGTFDLGGRSLIGSDLPLPVYNVQEEGRVVVTITVNPAGQVIATSINRQTNTINSALRKAAEEAARKARFNAIEGMNNQEGTITYYFNLK